MQVFMKISIDAGAEVTKIDEQDYHSAGNRRREAATILFVRASRLFADALNCYGRVNIITRLLTLSVTQM